MTCGQSTKMAAISYDNKPWKKLEDMSLMLLSYENGREYGEYLYKEDESKYTVKDLAALNKGTEVVYAEVILDANDEEEEREIIVLPRCRQTNKIRVSYGLIRFI